jgi:hypothetical protein
LYLSRHGLTDIDPGYIIGTALGYERIRRFDLGEDVFPFRTRAICEAEMRMENMAAEYKWICEENKTLAAQVEALKNSQRSASVHPEMDTGPSKEDHRCDQCGMLVQHVCTFVAEV